jgi:methylated-DNA-[protein]-cysteine S-methyltransferase
MASRFDRGGRLAVEMSVSSGWTIYESPIGPLTVVSGRQGITSIYFPGRRPSFAARDRRPLEDAVEQLDAYFAGERRAFELDLDLRGTPFQLEVWRRLLAIPYAATTTYGEIARRVDDSLYAPGVEPHERPRVVGAAIGRNPVPVVVPCHRVIGADGSLTGYYGGLERKRTLLDLESRAATGRAFGSDAPSTQTALAI